MIKRAMILAAGEGRRMRPLTLATPKPLLQVGERKLIEWHLHNLKAAGIEDVVINVAWLGQQIVDYLEDGSRYGVSISYSCEHEPLETGGALNRAHDLFCGEPTLMINGDVWTDFPLRTLLHKTTNSFHLVMIENPLHNCGGDFSLTGGRIERAAAGVASCTYSGICLFHPDIIQAYPQKRDKFPLREVFEWLIDQERLTGEVHTGQWVDVGTPGRLAELRTILA